MKNKSKEIWVNTAVITALSACIMLGAVGAYRLAGGKLAHGADKNGSGGAALTEANEGDDAEESKLSFSDANGSVRS